MYSNGALGLWATNAMLGGIFPIHAAVKEAAAGEAPKFYGSEKPLARKSIHKPTKLSSSCSSSADQIILREHDALFIANKGLKRGVAESSSADESESATGATTKHPRHRPGCGCVVCTQPPSRNGKNLSRRKKKRQSGPKAEVSEGYAAEAPISNINIRRGDVGDDMLAEALAGISMDSLIHAASMPLDMFLRENKNPSLT